MAAIERDFDDVRAAWEWAVAQGQLGALDTMAHGLYLFGFLGRRHVETLTMFQATLARPIADEALLGRLLVRRWGSLHWWLQDLSDYGAALAGVERALAIAERHAATFEIAFCHLMAAYALMGLGRNGEVLPHLETSKALFAALDEPYYVCWVLSRLGYLYAALNDPDKEIEATEQSLALARAMQNRFAMFSCLYNLGSDYLLNGDYVTGRAYGAEALRCANDTGQLCQVSHAASLLALQAFYQGDYQACRRHSDHSLDVIRDILLLVVQPYSLALLILLACLREDYAEAVRINELSRQHSVNAMGSQLNAWALAALACGLGRLADARAAIRSALERTPTSIHPATTMWIAPCAAVVLAHDAPGAAVRLLAWARTSTDPALGWAQHWPLVERLRSRLEATLDPAIYQAEWAAGSALSLERLASFLHAEFRAAADAHADPGQHYLLTTREREILRLIAAGKTNPQIAEQLIIGAGTVKTHTLNIYRKLEVANRTQAIVRAQEWGLLSA